MTKKRYLDPLGKLRDFMLRMPNTRLSVFYKIIHLANLVLQYELIEFNTNLHIHPYRLVYDLIISKGAAFHSLVPILDFGFPGIINKQFKTKHVLHHELWNQLWNRYDDDHMKEYISRYQHRIRVNKLDVKDKQVLDIGCGNGAFLFAMLKEGAKSAVGVDFGEASICHAEKYADSTKYEVKFITGSAYDLPFCENEFNFIIQNGVFHHLEHKHKAIDEAYRVLMPGGYFWYYTNGEGSIKADLFTAAREILHDVPTEYIVQVLSVMGLSENKINYLSDGFKARYSYTTLQRLKSKLANHGFSIVRRLTGGTDTDFDQDKIENDPYGREKWGEGNLRILCRKEKTDERLQ